MADLWEIHSGFMGVILWLSISAELTNKTATNITTHSKILLQARVFRIFHALFSPFDALFDRDVCYLCVFETF